jgi:hypothetical protein
MSLFTSKQPQVDLDRLEDEIGTAVEEHRTRVPRERQDHTKEPEYTRLQIIGHAITTLTWSDAVKMGEAIQSMLAQEPSGSVQNITAAIQKWAKDWEKFID